MKIGFLVPDNRQEFRHYDLPEPTFGPAPSSLLEGFAQLPECEVHIVCCSKRPMRRPERVAPNIFFHQSVVPLFGWARIGFPAFVASVRSRLHKIQPDIVHGQGTERYCGLSAAHSGFPNLITIHGNMRKIATVQNARPFSFLWTASLFERWTIPRTDGVLCITNYTKNLVKDLARRTWVVPNAADSRSFKIQRKPAPLREVVCLANILSYKNQIGLLEALEPLARHHSFKLRFFGKTTPGDPYGERFTELVKRHDWCEYPGHVEKEGVEEALSRAAILVLPSFEDNCPMVVLEAMAAGVPVVAASIGGVPDLIQDGVNGLLCDPASAESMRRAVERLLQEPALADALAARGRLASEARFAPKAVARRHLEIYRELLDSPAS